MTNSLFDKLVGLIREDAAAGLQPAFLQTAPIEPGMTLAELGIDSIGRMALLTALMDLTDLTEQDIADETFVDGQTLGDIVDWANNHTTCDGCQLPLQENL